MRFEQGWDSNWVPRTIAGVCAYCNSTVTFDPPGEGYHDVGDRRHESWIAIRVCPNPDCRGISCLQMHEDDIVQQFPPVRRSFPNLELPSSVAEPLDEALTCQANSCYVATAMVVRRTIEALCADRGARGETLWQRIEDLRQRVVLPSELFEAMQDVRLLGNDAAHITSREFDQVGADEVDSALALVEQLVMALYGYGELLGRLRNLKKKDNSGE